VGDEFFGDRHRQPENASKPTDKSTAEDSGNRVTGKVPNITGRGIDNRFIIHNESKKFGKSEPK